MHVLHVPDMMRFLRVTVAARNVERNGTASAHKLFLAGPGHVGCSGL